MTQDQKKEGESGSMARPIAVGLAGAAVAVTTVALLDKNRRKKVGKIITQIKEKGEIFTDKALTAIDDANKAVAPIKRKVKRGAHAMAHTSK